ncbi:Sensor_kinase_SpoOB-type, alpha-helical domain [Caminicella sporogenes DSM 14501]|uniref:histidine kinase n=1 Tax=Caminicella sporogenes DSM 14501 TaxID=1121266 RepID=A0A1M6RQK6_9FIRM|nr:ATP-binding protein [Caminicella sporogenes]RKD23679.1 hypothetical protein BET04_04595 [Caminicella sporogenes]SHK34618.1 Sensor_kinase_SpoOB-type, alpha-helical domain [Caminicella sporogenes DSM 14501]
MKLKTKAYILVLLILLQSLSIMFLTNNLIINLMGKIIIYEYPTFVGIILNILGFIAIINVFYIIKFLKKEEESIRKLNRSKEVIEALRGQKHDFNNHLNVIAGMIQLNKPNKALEYIYNICGKTNEFFSISKIENVEVAAILYSKFAIAESKGITVELDINTSLSELKIDNIELSKILFNLLDNAIYELEKSTEDEKILTIDIGESDDRYFISIINSYPILSPKLYDKIFEKGFSTKKGENHGYGLNIVKKIVEKNKGQITVESYEGVGTIFTVIFPKTSETQQTAKSLSS